MSEVDVKAILQQTPASRPEILDDTINVAEVWLLTKWGAGIYKIRGSERGNYHRLFHSARRIRTLCAYALVLHRCSQNGRSVP